MPARQRRVVVFPAPFGPTRPSTCAGRRRAKREAVDGGDVAVRLDEPLDADHGREFRLDAMPRLQLTTAGESHGPKLTAILSGLPAGLLIDAAAVDFDLARRQHGYGRGGRMKIERDSAVFTGGLRGGETLGGPVAFEIANRDHGVWAAAMGPLALDVEAARKRRVASPRPGHADLAGGLKYGRRDLRDVLERASARESAARVAAGALCRQLLARLRDRGPERRPLGRRRPRARSPRAASRSATSSGSTRRRRFRARRPARRGGDDGGRRRGREGGRHARRARSSSGRAASRRASARTSRGTSKLDGRIAQAMMSIPSVKAVSLGEGVANAFRPGSRAHDPIAWDEERGFFRTVEPRRGARGGDHERRGRPRDRST